MYVGDFDLSVPMLFTVENILSQAECDQLIESFEARGPELATVNSFRGDQVQRELRNNSRVIEDDPELAARLFERAAPHLPQRISGRSICGANERLRFYRYQPGEYFGLHRDGSFERSSSERSLLTYMVYLNGGFEGGETDFPELGKTVVPEAGLGVFFQHRVAHEGKKLIEGVKYALRTDVMYKD